MQSKSNEQLCALAQKGDPVALDLLLENNLGFIRKTANELYRSMNLFESSLCLDQDDLIQEGSIGLLNTVTHFDDSRGMKFLTYAAPAIRNAMIDFVRAEISQFEIKISEKDGLGFRIIRLEDILSEEDQMQRIEAIAHPFVLSPEEIYIKKEEIGELYQALRELNDREQTYLLYRFGFSDDIEHPYRSMNLFESSLCLDNDDLIQEGSIGLLNAVTRFDDSRGMKFLTYAAPAIRNAMIDFVRAEVSQFETKISEKDGIGFRIIRLEDILSEEEQMQRIEAIAHPFVLSPEEIYIKKEEIGELYQALQELNDREQTYLLYRFGFLDDIEHPLIGTAVHFHLTESRARRTEKEAMDHLRSQLPWWY